MAGNRPPHWVRDAVFYQIFPDRFARSSRIPKPAHLEPWDAAPTSYGFKGGDLAGIVEQLDWLTELGVTAVYLNPIFQSTANHRYHTFDYYRVDPLLGGDDAFRELLDACHSRHLRVVLDGVFNHASRGFFQFNDILENGAASPWLDWFVVTGWPLHAYHPHQPPNYEAWWGNPALPKFNTDNPEVREYLMQVAEHWTATGIDGWRLDVPNEITTTGFWEEFRERVKAHNPELYLVGEIWGDARRWIGDAGRFDGTMNYQFTGHTIAFTAGDRVDASVAEGLDYPVKPALDAAGYGAAIEALLALYPEETTEANLNLLGSHDTARVLTVAGGDVDSVVLAALLLFTFPGAPCIYYGDELGLAGGKDPENRGAFPWDHPESWDQVLLDTYRSLVRLRHEHPALRHGSYAQVAATEGLYVFRRDSDTERLLVAVNAAEDAGSTTVEAPGSSLRRRWGGGQARLRGDQVHISLPARTGALWEIGA